MLKEKGIDWNVDAPFILKHGIYLKKIMYEKKVNGQSVKRTKIIGKTFKIKCDDYFKKIILAKYWEDFNIEGMSDLNEEKELA